MKSLGFIEVRVTDAGLTWLPQPMHLVRRGTLEAQIYASLLDGMHRYVNYAGRYFAMFPHVVPPALLSPPAFLPQRHPHVTTPMCVHACLRARY